MGPRLDTCKKCGKMSHSVMFGGTGSALVALGGALVVKSGRLQRLVEIGAEEHSQHRSWILYASLS